MGLAEPAHIITVIPEEAPVAPDAPPEKFPEEAPKEPERNPEEVPA